MLKCPHCRKDFNIKDLELGIFSLKTIQMEIDEAKYIAEQAELRRMRNEDKMMPVMADRY